MSVSGVGGPTVAVPAPAPMDRVPSEAARDAAGTTTTSGSATARDAAVKDSAAKEAAAKQAAKDAEATAERRAKQDEPAPKVPPLKGLSIPDMLTLLGMRPVSPAEAARTEAAQAAAQHSGQGSGGQPGSTPRQHLGRPSFDGYA